MEMQADFYPMTERQLGDIIKLSEYDFSTLRYSGHNSHSEAWGPRHDVMLLVGEVAAKGFDNLSSVRKINS